MDNTVQTVQRKIDVLSFLSRVVQSNTEFYKSDFSYDIAVLQNAAREHGMANRSFLWMSRRSGTWCLNERDVFLRDTGAFSTWTYYETAAAGIQAYRIAVTGCQEGTVIGDIFPLNYTEHVRRVKQNALSIQFITASFEDGSIMTMEHDEYRRGKAALQARHGKITEIVYSPKSETELTHTLMLEHRLELPKRKQTKDASIRNPVH